MGYRYIGSKARIADEIIEYINRTTFVEDGGFFIDAFSGTGVVAERAALSGWPVYVNDMMSNAVIMSEARLLSVEDVPFSNLNGYRNAIRLLNALPGQEGFIWREYSPASAMFQLLERRYFIEDNAKKIDAIATAIHTWRTQGVISQQEYVLLLSDLIRAVNDVANIAGTYGCFLSRWTTQAKEPLNLQVSELKNKAIIYKTSNCDVFEIESTSNESDPQVKNILSTAISEFGRQGLPSKQKLSVPPRNKEWQQAYDLSFDIVQGLGSSYDTGRFVAPGFVVDTWKLWEWLITTGVRLGNITRKVFPQNSISFGYKETTANRYIVNVFPDIEVMTEENQMLPLYLVDAKYKLLKNSSTGEIERDDLYEAFAFCSATDTKEIVLVYPMDTPTEIPGEVKKCSTYYIKDVMVHVIQASFGSMREKGGIYTFTRNITSGIESVLLST